MGLEDCATPTRSTEKYNFILHVSRSGHDELRLSEGRVIIIATRGTITVQSFLDYKTCTEHVTEICGTDGEGKVDDDRFSTLRAAQRLQGGQNTENTEWQLKEVPAHAVQPVKLSAQLAT